MCCSALSAQDLRIGLKTDITSVDPHYHVWGPNMALARHIFEPLISQDEMQRLKPSLATSWRYLSPKKLEVTLKKGVVFHDGSPFTIDDVVYSLRRAQKERKPFSGFTVYAQHIKDITPLDDTHLVIESFEPYSLLAADLAVIAMMKKPDHELTAQEMNRGIGAIGTGPYQFEKWQKGDFIKLKRFENYHAQKPAFKNVTMRILNHETARLNALLAGDVDFIETVPISEMPRIENNKDFEIFSGVPSRLIYLVPDLRHKTPHMHQREPYFTDFRGRPLTEKPSPLKDFRVRKALSLAIDRESLCRDLMQGFARPASQIVPAGSIGHVEGLKPDPFDLEKAKKLLHEAGFLEGDLRLTIHSPQGRYVFDQKMVEAIAPMFARLGIETKVELLPPALFMSRSRKGAFSLSLGGWPVNREVISPLKALLHTKDPEKGLGTFNRGFYSSKAVDGFIEKALGEMREVKRDRLLQQASAWVVKDYAMIPIMFQYNTWAAKKGLHYTPRMDEYTLIESIKVRGQ